MMCTVYFLTVKNIYGDRSRVYVRMFVRVFKVFGIFSYTIISISRKFSMHLTNLCHIVHISFVSIFTKTNRFMDKKMFSCKYAPIMFFAFSQRTTDNSVKKSRTMLPSLHTSKRL